MLVVREASKKEEKRKMELPVPVKTEKPPEINQQALYLIISLMDVECSRGFRHAEMVKRKGGQLVLTDEANSISEDPARIPNFVWDMKKIRDKTKESGAINNLWDSLSSGKQRIISFKGANAEENAKIAYEILRAAGFEEDMLKFASKRSIKILGLPDNFDIAGLTERLAKNLERVKTDNAKVEAAETAQARAERQEEIKKEFAEMFGNEGALAHLNPKAAAEMIRYIHDSASPSESMLYSVWFLLNKRPDVVQIVNELRTTEPYEPWLRPFSAMRKDEYLAMIKSMREEKPLEGIATIAPMQKGKIGTGKEHEELRAYERERRGRPSLPEVAAAAPWKLDPVFRERLEKGDAVVLYAFPSLQGYAEARAAVELLYPGRAIEVEHTPEFRGRDDVGEWTIKVHPPGETINQGLEVAKGIRTNTGKMADVHVSWKHGTKRESLTIAAAAYDAVNNNSTYTTEVAIDTSDPSSMPNWLRPLVAGKTMGALKESDRVRKIVLAKGADLTVEIDPGRTVERRDGSHVYVYKVTISGESMRKELQAARNEAKKKAAEPLPLKRIAELEEPAAEPTYAERMAALKKKVPPTS